MTAPPEEGTGEVTSQEAILRKRADDEVTAIAAKYRNAGELRYVVQKDGVSYETAFVSSRLMSHPGPPDEYELHLLAPPSVIIRGECTITDSNGLQIEAGANTSRQGTENRIVVTANA